MRLRGSDRGVAVVVRMLPLGSIATERIPVARLVVASLVMLLLALGYDDQKPGTAPLPHKSETSVAGSEPSVVDTPLARLKSLLSTYVEDQLHVWDAYDAVALDHLNVKVQISDSELQAWLRSLPARDSEPEHFGFLVDASSIFITWTDYPFGARVSLFNRYAGNRWELAQTHDLKLEGGYVSLAWRKKTALVVAGSFRTGDSNRLTLIGLDVHGGIEESLRLEMIGVGSVELPDGVSVRTWVSPLAIVTHLFSHWREVDVTVRWQPHGFTVTRRDLEPVVAVIDNYCMLRRDRDPAADRLVLGGRDLRERLPSDCMRMTLEDVTYASDTRARVLLSGAYTCALDHDDADETMLGVTDEISLELRRTGSAWRISGITSPDPDCRPYRQQVR